MNLCRTRILILALLLVPALHGCKEAEPPYGVEEKLSLPGTKRQVWAVAPAINLSGQANVDPLLQADIVFQQLQSVAGITVIPVNRVAEVYSTLRIDKVQSEDQAAIVCELLGADAIVVPTVTIFDPYNPPKFGASLQLLRNRNPGDAVRERVDPAPARPPSRAAARPAYAGATAGLVPAVGRRIRRRRRLGSQRVIRLCAGTERSGGSNGT